MAYGFVLRSPHVCTPSRRGHHQLGNPSRSNEMTTLIRMADLGALMVDRANSCDIRHPRPVTVNFQTPTISKHTGRVLLQTLNGD